MSLRLELNLQTTTWLDLSSLDWNEIAGSSLDSIRRVPIDSGLGRTTLGEYFTVHGNNDTRRAIIVGDCQRVHGIGCRLNFYELIVEGNVGDRLGSEMRGGTIHVLGSAGDWIGGPVRGGRSGMRGGLVFVKGRAGRYVGFRQRRGTIQIDGDVGAACGAEMIAGTIVVAAAEPTDFGIGMKRGTIICEKLAEADAIREAGGGSFSRPQPIPDTILQLTARFLLNSQASGHGSAETSNRCLQSLYNFARSHNDGDRWFRRLGDASVNGMGEVWYRVAESRMESRNA